MTPLGCPDCLLIRYEPSLSRCALCTAGGCGKRRGRYSAISQRLHLLATAALRFPSIPSPRFSQREEFFFSSPFTFFIYNFFIFFSVPSTSRRSSQPLDRRRRSAALAGRASPGERTPFDLPPPYSNPIAPSRYKYRYSRICVRGELVTLTQSDDMYPG